MIHLSVDMFCRTQSMPCHDREGVVHLIIYQPKGIIIKMHIRKFQESDLDTTYHVRASTRQNPISKEQLSEWGFTPDSVLNGYRDGRTVGWVCEDNGNVVGFCSGDITTGEVIFEGAQIFLMLLIFPII